MFTLSHKYALILNCQLCKELQLSVSRPVYYGKTAWCGKFLENLYVIYVMLAVLTRVRARGGARACINMTGYQKED